MMPLSSSKATDVEGLLGLVDAAGEGLDDVLGGFTRTARLGEIDSNLAVFGEVLPGDACQGPGRPAPAAGGP